MAAIANLPIGWLFGDARRQGDDLILPATGTDGDEIEVSGRTTEEAWRAMAESLAAPGDGRLMRWPAGVRLSLTHREVTIIS